MRRKLKGAIIEVLSTGKTYHTWRDWHLVMETTNPLGPPEQETLYLDVPGADGFLDYSQVLTGKPVFKKRCVEFTLGGNRDMNTWLSFVSQLRGLLEGQKVHIIFDDLLGYYWEGRLSLSFDRSYRIGKVTFSIPQADPYGYSVQTNNDPWLWDPFDFEFGVIDPIGFELKNGTRVVTFEGKGVPFKVEVTVENSSGLYMTTAHGDRYALPDGKHIFGFSIEPPESLTFTGTGKVVVTYRRRIL